MKQWKLYEIIWLLFFSAIAIILSTVSNDSLFNFSVFITGVLCVVLAAKGNIWTYVFGMYNTLGYAYLSYTNGLYGEMGLNLLFFVPMNIVGFFMWKRHLTNDTVDMRQLPVKTTIVIIAFCILSILGLGYLLALIPKQNTPYIDAVTDVLSIVATILMVYRFKEQWLLYIILNVFTIIMWAIRLKNGSPDGLIMIIMWSAYLVNAIYGYYTWNSFVLKSKQYE